jgi:hypothetical protein
VQDKKVNEINNLRFWFEAYFAAVQQALIGEVAFYFCA